MFHLYVYLSSQLWLSDAYIVVVCHDLWIHILSGLFLCLQCPEYVNLLLGVFLPLYWQLFLFLYCCIELRMKLVKTTFVTLMFLLICIRSFRKWMKILLRTEFCFVCIRYQKVIVNLFLHYPCAEWLDPPSPLCRGYQDYFSWCKGGWSVELTTLLCVVTEPSVCQSLLPWHCACL